MYKMKFKLGRNSWKVLKPLEIPPKLKIVCLIVPLVLLLGVITAQAVPPPRQGVKWPSGVLQRLRTFQYKRSYLQMMRRIQLNRAAVRRGEMTMAAAQAIGGIAVTGTKSIPVLTAKFNNTAADPYPITDLQKELFDGPWPTGTMTDYYRENSYGQFAVTGTVFPWKKASNNDTYYEGGTGCNGVCASSKVGELLKETMDLNDAAVDFSTYDNDGPDGVPNSGDDDGYVDFVAFVHPESGGECGNNNIWSHRWVYSGWTGNEYTTNDPKTGGGFIKIDDYVIMPGFACDGATMIEIGVFAHEFGHAFGLPDLYDTDSSNGDSEGIGNWGLMAGGSWGGDGNSPEKPSHMSAWSKEFLGWITPTVVNSDLIQQSIGNIEENPTAYKVSISPTEYYLVSNRQKKLFDIKLLGAGLLIWHINETVINAGLPNNTVNADENNKGVDLEEADGRNDLDNTVNRGDAGDVFPGTENMRKFDNTTNPSSSGSIAVCNISDPADFMAADLLISTGICPGLAISLVLDPNKRLRKDEEATVRATVTMNGSPQPGKTVTFMSLDTSLASIRPPVTDITDSNGIAEATVRGEELWQKKTVMVKAEVDGTSTKVPVKVPDLSLTGFAVLVAFLLLLGASRRKSEQR